MEAKRWLKSERFQIWEELNTLPLDLDQMPLRAKCPPADWRPCPVTTNNYKLLDSANNLSLEAGQSPND
jgi:hypothetical protein